MAASLPSCCWASPVSGQECGNQLELITVLGSPKPETVKDRTARGRYLEQLPRKGRGFSGFPMASTAQEVIRSCLPSTRTRISASDALEDPYFVGLFKSSAEGIAKPLSKLDYGFDQKTLREGRSGSRVQEILEYHKDAKKQYMSRNSSHVYHFPSQVDRFKMQFMNLEQGVWEPGDQECVVLPKQGLAATQWKRAARAQSLNVVHGATFEDDSLISATPSTVHSASRSPWWGRAIWASPSKRAGPQQRLLHEDVPGLAEQGRRQPDV